MKRKIAGIDSLISFLPVAKLSYGQKPTEVALDKIEETFNLAKDRRIRFYGAYLMETMHFKRVDRPEEAQNPWKCLCSLAGALAILLTSCTTENAIQRSSQLEKTGDPAGAYTNIVDALQVNPDNEKLLAEKKLIGQKYADDLLQQSSSLPTNDLTDKIKLLQSAAQVDCTNKIAIASAASDLEQERTAML